MGRLLSVIKAPIGQLSEERLLRTAQRKTGLSDFGDERFRIPFRILVRSYKEEGRLNFILDLDYFLFPYRALISPVSSTLTE